MRAAQAQVKERAEAARAQAYMTAMLMRAQELPDYREWVTGEKDRAKEVARFFAAWDRVGPALARNKRAQ